MKELKWKSGIYKITNIKNNKFYIGSSNNLARRLKRHIHELNRGIHHNSHLQKAWEKYGEDAFDITIIEYCNDDELLLREQYYLDLYKSYDYKIGYNHAKFAEAPTRGISQSEERKQKQRERMIGNKYSLGRILPQEHIDKIIIANKGRKLSETQKKAIGDFHRGKTHTEESKRKMSESHKGKTVPTEVREKISKGLSGDNHYLYGKHLSEETKRKISQGNKGKVIPDDVKSKISETLKGMRKGENHPTARLTECIVKEIKIEIYNGSSLKNISEKYDISITHASNIKTGRTWSHVHLDNVSNEELKNIKNDNVCKGEEANNSKLKITDVIEIKRLLNEYTPVSIIAKQFNVSKYAIQYIRSGKTWRHVV